MRSETDLGAQHREQQAVRQQHSDDPRSAGSQRQPDGNLSHPCGCAGQHHAGHVRAGYQRGLQTLHRNHERRAAEAAVIARIGGLEHLRHRLEGGPCLRPSYARRQPHDQGKCWSPALFQSGATSPMVTNICGIKPPITMLYPRGITPVTVNSRPLRLMVRPMMSRSRPKRRAQKS